jgi:hypothetical protein
MAWREFKEEPVVGSGGGTFDEFWLDWRTVDSYARRAQLVPRDAGVPSESGLAAVPVGTLPPLRAPPRPRSLRATAAAGYVAYLIHTGVDWDWSPATTIAGLLCGAALLVEGRRDARELSGRTRIALLLIIVALAVVATTRLHSGPHLPFAP